ncbi:MAG: hypothetical protein KGL43_24820 [Burkholderiales bacterium]|nr:hypothetical protein [Burkholderiales bacterium]MDE2395457.1 hypothetical protein [Burkholderiales bacterium]MDE2456825.1 hypothetical protein [Burkholderiales bacterium]
MAEIHELPGAAAPHPADPEGPSETALTQAAYLFSEIASLAHRTDRQCFYSHAAFDALHVDADHVNLELTRLRDVICRLGWMADLGCAKLTGHEDVRGDAEKWLMPPVYNDIGRREED